MKFGKSINDLAKEIQRQYESKRDFLVPANQIKAYKHEANVEIGFATSAAVAVRGKKKLGEPSSFFAPLTENGHKQMGEYLGIPKKYYDIMLRECPELLATNMQHWLSVSKEKKLIRALDGQVRAVLSDKYRRLDNYDLAQHILPMLHEADAQIESCDITEKKLYLKAVTHKVQGEVKPGDVVSAGVIISNSETGHGSLNVSPMIYRLVCKNGAIANDYAMRKYHAGRQQEMEQIEFKKDTIIAEDKAFWLKVRDLVAFSLSEVTFDKIVNSMRESTKKVIAEPNTAIELAADKFSFNETEQQNVLKYLINGGDLTNWGFGNAITRAAQDVASYDRSTELESLGFDAMSMNWN